MSREAARPRSTGPFLGLSWWQLTFLIGFPVFLITFLLTATCHRPPPAKVLQKHKPITVENARPETVAQSFLTLLQVRDFEMAYDYLSQGVRERTPQGEFRLHMDDWLKDDNVRWELQHRRAALVSSTATRADVSVSPPPTGGNSWQWVLIKQDDGWKIHGMAGGPLSPER